MLWQGEVNDAEFGLKKQDSPTCDRRKRSVAADGTGKTPDRERIAVPTALGLMMHGEITTLTKSKEVAKISNCASAEVTFHVWCTSSSNFGISHVWKGETIMDHRLCAMMCCVVYAHDVFAIIPH